MYRIIIVRELGLAYVTTSISIGQSHAAISNSHQNICKHQTTKFLAVQTEHSASANLNIHTVSHFVQGVVFQYIAPAVIQYVMIVNAIMNNEECDLAGAIGYSCEQGVSGASAINLVVALPPWMDP